MEEHKEGDFISLSDQSISRSQGIWREGWGVLEYMWFKKDMWWEYMRYEKVGDYLVWQGRQGCDEKMKERRREKDNNPNQGYMRTLTFVTINIMS